MRNRTLSLLLTLGVSLLAASLVAQPAPRVWLDADAQPLPFDSADELVDFLATAEIVDSEALTAGITKPFKLTLERDGVRANAIFHSIDLKSREVKRLESGRMSLHLVDSYKNQVAAYVLSRMLALDCVPPTAMRTFDGRRGSAQLWIQKAMTEQGRRDQALDPPDWNTWNHQRAERGVFDNLINNIDRNTGNTLIDEVWNMWLVDHTRTFGQDRQLPYPDRIESLSPEFWYALRDLDPDALRASMEPYLGKAEVKSLLSRHEKVVEAIERRIADRGEERVLRVRGVPRVRVRQSDG